MHDVIVMVVHEDGDRLADDQRHPHGHVARLAVEESIHKHGKRYLQTRTRLEQVLVTSTISQECERLRVKTDSDTLKLT